jgi:hypothetical protein
MVTGSARAAVSYLRRIQLSCYARQLSTDCTKCQIVRRRLERSGETMSSEQIADKRVHLYTPVHKGQRRTLSGLSSAAGTLDLDDPKAVERLHGDMVSFREEIHLHASNEEKFIHPLLSARIPGIARPFEKDHVVLHRMLDELVGHSERMRTEQLDRPSRESMALEFYRALNRFSSFNLAHVDREQEGNQVTLWAHYSDEVLAAAFGRILAAQTPPEMMMNLGHMLPAMNPAERIGLLGMAKAGMPPAAFNAAAELAGRVLSPADWADVRKKLGI